MIKLMSQILLTGLAASVSPVAIAACIDILTYRNAVKNSLYFLAAFGATLLSIGMVGLYVFSSGYGSAVIPASIKGYVDIGLGLICFGLLLYLFKKQPKQNSDIASRSGESMTPRKATTMGVLLMLTNSSTLVIYVSGLHIIVTAKLSLANDILILGILTLVSLTTVIAPILMYALSPKKAGERLALLGTWLNKHNKSIGVIILGGFGIYLIARGLRGL